MDKKNVTPKTRSYDVTIPITGIICRKVEASSPEEAIELALAGDLELDEVIEWEAHTEICEGNIFHGVQNEATADLSEDQL